MATRNLKCGGPTKGKKKKHMVDGGPTPISVKNLSGSFAKMNNLPQSKLLESGLAKGPKSASIGSPISGSEMSPDMFIKAGNMAGNYAEELITSKVKEEEDWRKNPLSQLRTNDTLKASGKIAGNTLKGAGVGATVGTFILPGVGTGLGAAIGAGVGAAFTGLKEGLMSKKKKEERSEKLSEWITGHAKNASESLVKSGYKTGGSIEGKGTGTSDSIDMKAPDGAFIVPAENAEIAEELGRSFLGWDNDEKAKRNNGGTDIKVSNGEVYFDPEEVKILKYHKINLDELAPNAENSVNMKKGGEKNTKKQESPWTHDKDQDLVINDATKTAYDKSGAEYVFNIDENKYVKLKSGSPYGIDIYNQATKGPDKDKPEWMNNLPEIAGIVQAGAGAVGLAKAGKAPSLEVSRALTGLSAELRKEAEYGLEPGAKTAMINQSERSRRNTTNAIVNRGGSSSDVMNNLQTMLGTTIDKNYNIEIAYAAEKARKKGLYYSTRAKIGDQEFDIAKINLEEYYKNQEMFAGLASAGISNIVGARQLKTEQDTLKEIGSNRPTWKS